MDKASFLSSAQTLLEQGAHDSALEMARHWLEANPGDVDALIVQCHACMRLGKLEEATSLIEDVEMTVLGLSRIYACMGDICFKGGLNQEAVKFYRRFMTLNPDSDLSRDVAGKLRTLEEEEQSTFIRQNSSREAAVPPLSAGFQTVTMVDLYIRQGHLDAAESLLEQMLAEAPDDPTLQEKWKSLLALKSASAKKALRVQHRENVLTTLNRWLDYLQKRKLYAF